MTTIPARPERSGAVRPPLTGPRLPARLRSRRPLAMPPARSRADRS